MLRFCLLGALASCVVCAKDLEKTKRNVTMLQNGVCVNKYTEEVTVEIKDGIKNEVVVVNEFEC